MSDKPKYTVNVTALRATAEDGMLGLDVFVFPLKFPMDADAIGEGLARELRTLLACTPLAKPEPVTGTSEAADAERFRWLCEDPSNSNDRSEQNRILERMRDWPLSTTRARIDMSMHQWRAPEPKGMPPAAPVSEAPDTSVACLLNIPLVTLAKLLQLPESATVEHVEMEPGTRDTALLRIVGAGWPTAPGNKLQHATAVIDQTNAICEKKVNYSFPQDNSPPVRMADGTVVHFDGRVVRPGEPRE